jgi:hypothetical protein
MLRAGAAKVDITPEAVRDTFVAGFGMGKRATGVHMPLEASAVYIEAGDARVVFVSLDLVGLLEAWIDKIRAAVTEVPGTALVVACTHTHAGPDTMGYWGPSIFKVFPRSDGKNPAYMFRLVERVAACVDEAVRAARPVTVRFASFEHDAEWVRNDRKGGGRYDHVEAVGLDDERGRRLATVINFAAHPETLWEHNTLLSPDFVGPLRARIASEVGGEVVYWSGPLGAMLTPNVHAGERDVEARIAYIERFGAALADGVIAALDAAEPVGEAGLAHHTERVRLTNSNWRFKLLERLGFIDVLTEGDAVTAPVHHVSFGPLTVLTAPGELCPELGERIRTSMSTPHRMVVCLCEDEFGYLLEPSMFDDPEYAYEVTMSLGRSSADTLLAAHARLLDA